MTEPLPEEVVENFKQLLLFNPNKTSEWTDDDYGLVLSVVADDPEFTQWFLAKCVADGVLKQIGIMASDKLLAEQGIDRSDEAAIATLEGVDAEGGLDPMYQDRVHPVYRIEGRRSD